MRVSQIGYERRRSRYDRSVCASSYRPSLQRKCRKHTSSRLIVSAWEARLLPSAFLFWSPSAVNADNRNAKDLTELWPEPHLQFSRYHTSSRTCLTSCYETQYFEGPLTLSGRGCTVGTASGEMPVCHGLRSSSRSKCTGVAVPRTSCLRRLIRHRRH